MNSYGLFWILQCLLYVYDPRALLTQAIAGFEDQRIWIHLKTWSGRHNVVVILDGDNPWEIWTKNPIPKDRHGLLLYLHWLEDELKNIQGQADGWVIHLKQLAMVVDAQPDIAHFIKHHAGSITEQVLAQYHQHVPPRSASRLKKSDHKGPFPERSSVYRESIEQILDDANDDNTDDALNVQGRMEKWLTLAKDTPDQGGEMAYLLAQYMYFDARMDRLGLGDFTTAQTYLCLAVESSNVHAKVLLAILHLAQLWPQDDHDMVMMNDVLARRYLVEGSESQNDTTALLSNLVLGFQSFTSLGGLEDNNHCESTLEHWSQAASIVVSRMTTSKDGVTGHHSDEPVYLVNNDQETGSPQRMLEEEEEDEDTLMYYESILKHGETHPLAPNVAARMGEMHLFGAPHLNMPPDPNQAFNYFQRAAALGQAQASAYLGFLYANGMVGEGPNPVLAQEHFERGAVQNNGLANFGLGHMYLTGKEVEQNVTKAVKYLKKSAEVGYTEAYNHLAVVYLNGMGELSQNQTQAFEYFQLSTNAGSVQSRYNLAILTMNGWGTNQSCPVASNHFRKVALSGIFTSREGLFFSLTQAHALYRQGQVHRAYIQYAIMGQLGNSVALSNLAYIVEHNLSSPRSIYDQSDSGRPEVHHHHHRQAFQLYQVASSLDDPVASRKLGDCYAESWPDACTHDMTHALEHYAQAAAQGDVFSMYICGTIYASSTGNNLDLAKDYFKQCNTALGLPQNMPCQLQLWWIKVRQVMSWFAY